MTLNLQKNPVVQRRLMIANYTPFLGTFTLSEVILKTFLLLHFHLLLCSLSFLTSRHRFQYCSQSGPSGQLLCSSVHLNIILLIKGLPPTISTRLPPLPFSHMAPAFCSPRHSPTRFMSSHALAISKEETSPLSLPLSCGFNLFCNIAESVLCGSARACVSGCLSACGVHLVAGSSGLNQPLKELDCLWLGADKRPKGEVAFRLNSAVDSLYWFGIVKAFPTGDSFLCSFD